MDGYERSGKAGALAQTAAGAVEGADRFLQAREKDTRRKFLIGGIVLAKVKRGEWTQAKLTDLLDRELKEDRDRVLSDLPPLPETKSSDATYYWIDGPLKRL